MVARTEFDSELGRAQIAREEFISAFCADWPEIFKCQIPCTFDAATLLAAKSQLELMMSQIREKMTADLASPWDRNSTGVSPRMIDWNGVENVTRHALSISMRTLGMPATVKNGEGVDPADGKTKLYADFDEVKQAQADAPRTAEWVAQAEVAKIQRELNAISGEYRTAANAGDSDSIAPLAEKIEAIRETLKKAEKKLKSLRDNPVRGLKIVREIPDGFDTGAELRIR